MWTRILIIALCGCTGASMGDSASTPDDSTTLDPATVRLDGACAMEVDFGGFAVQSADGASGIGGSVADGVVPVSVLEEIASEGECRLLRRNNPFCDPACDAGDTCDFDGECLPYPANQDLGTIDLEGLAQPVSMEPVFPGNTYYDTSLPTPPFEPGAVVRLSMPGGVYGPGELFGVGIEPLALLEEGFLIHSGQDLVVSWEPPTATSRADISLRLSIDQHGATPAVLICDFADTGTGTVPGAVLASLVDSGVTGFPSGQIARQTVDHIGVGAGCMDLTLEAPLDVDIQVEGFTPCVSTADCPDGQECNEELQICE